MLNNQANAIATTMTVDVIDNDGLTIGRFSRWRRQMMACPLQGSARSAARLPGSAASGGPGRRHVRRRVRRDQGKIDFGSCSTNYAFRTRRWRAADLLVGGRYAHSLK